MKMEYMRVSEQGIKSGRLKRYGALFLVICLLVTAMPVAGSFADTRSKEVDEMWKTLKQDGILTKMSMGSQKYLNKLKGLLSSGDTMLGSKHFQKGSKTGECSGFADAIMKPLVGKSASDKNLKAYPGLRGKGYIDYTILRENGIPQRGATLIRTVSQSDKAHFEGQGDGSNGHSMVILYYDEQNIYTVEGNQAIDGNNKGYNLFFKRSYSEFNRNQLISTTGKGIRANDPRIIKYVVTVSNAEFKRMYDDAEEPVEINSTNFPDENFRKYVKTFDKDKDEILYQEEIKSVKKIEYDSGKEKKKDISNLKGIEFFTELTKLEIKNCSVEQVDLSKNVKLESVTLGCKLKALDVSKNNQLTGLRCDENNISKLTLGKQDYLKVLLVVNNHDKLRKIDISDCKVLCGIAKKYEPVVGPKYTLWGDPSSNTNRILLDNGMKLISKSDGGDEDTGTDTDPESITISGPESVEKGKTIQLTATVKPKEAKQEVSWSTGDKKIATVNEKGIVTGKKAGTVTITATSKAKSSVKASIKISVTDKLNDTIMIGKEHFPDAGFRKFVKKFDTNKDEKLSKKELAAVKEMYVGEEADENAKNLKGIEYFTELKRLTLAHQPLAELDLSKNLKLTNLTFYECRFKRLNVSKNTQLKSIYCQLCSLSELILGKQDNLSFLRCCLNRNLKTLDISGCKKILKFIKGKEPERVDYGGAYTLAWGSWEDSNCFEVDEHTKLIK